MKARPLAFLCLLIILIQSLIMMFGSGKTVVSPLPAGQVVFEGQVYQKSKTSNHQILYLKNNSIYDSNFIVYMKRPVEISIGQKICLRGEIKAFERARNPGNFDQAIYYACRGMAGKVWCEKVLSVTGTKNVFAEKLYEIKEAWKQAIFANMNEKDAAILTAMLLGEKGEMDENVKELYQKSGIGHLLAISGLHISFIGWGIYKILRKGGTPFWLAGTVAVGMLSAYGIMIGFSVSVFRAFVMLLLRIGADVTGRVYDMLTALLFSATLTILKEPYYLTDAAFLMSYGAIVGILFVNPKVQGKGFSALWSSVSVNLVLFPILLWFYYEFPVYSVALNLIAIPLMSILLGCGLLGSAFLWLSPLCRGSLWVCKLILRFYEWLGNFSSGLPSSRIVFGKPELWKIFVYYMLLMIILVLIGVVKKRRWFLWFVLGIFACTMGIHHSQDVQITMLDVGQGDGIYIKGPQGHTYFIDGGSSDVEKVAKYRIEPYLKSQGVGSLDYVFLTHGDGDHCNGIQEMLERQEMGVRIENLVVPMNYREDETLLNIIRMAKKQDVTILVIKKGQGIEEGDMTLTCLQPDAQRGTTGNEGSMVLDLQYKDFSMILTGDVERKGEVTLTETLEKQSYDVLKVSHHGSKNATSDKFLEKVNPKIGLISAGVDNAYQHPHPDVVKRLKNRGCTVFETAKKGAITVQTDGNSLTISLLPYRL